MERWEGERERERGRERKRERESERESIPNSLAVGEKLKSSDERDSMIVDCLVSLGRLDEAAKKLTEMIEAKPDQWAYIRTYITCQVQRCQNFKERVRQQLERDREKEEAQGGEGEREEGGEMSSEVNGEEKREGERQSGDTVKGKEDNDKDKIADMAENMSSSTEQTTHSGKEGGEGEREENSTAEEANEVTVR